MSFDRLYELLRGTELESWLETLDKQIQQGLCNDTYGKLAGWKRALKELPEIQSQRVDLNSEKITVEAETPLSEDEKESLKDNLKQLMPWRKGPYLIHGVDVDTEWRSDLKWQRLSSAIKPLKGRTVLDVGCGNGYHTWRTGYFRYRHRAI